MKKKTKKVMINQEQYKTAWDGERYIDIVSVVNEAHQGKRKDKKKDVRVQAIVKSSKGVNFNNMYDGAVCTNITQTTVKYPESK